ncbi:MAG: MBL fold metallo-hydrolase [Nitrososphaeria archaeon]
MAVRIYVLNDNMPGPGLMSDWGLSLLVEVSGLRILFDSGPSPRIISENARKLGVDLSRVDVFFLSHHHLDHSGGVDALPEGIPAYIPPGDLSRYSRLKAVEVRESREIAPGVLSTGPFESDPAEQAMVIKSEGMIILLVGCSHPGIDVIAERVSREHGRIGYLLGGFHRPSLGALRKALELSDFASPMHCSGELARRYASAVLKDRHVPLRTGSVVEVRDGAPHLIRP